MGEILDGSRRVASRRIEFLLIVHGRSADDNMQFSIALWASRFSSADKVNKSTDEKGVSTRYART